jgi:hypothetical protein
LVESIPVFPRRTRCLAAPRPENLRVGPYKHVGSPSLLFQAIAAIKELVVGPAVGEEESRAFGAHGETSEKARVGPGAALVETA